MEYTTEYVITKIDYQFIPELFSGLNLTTSLYRPVLNQEPLLIKRDFQILTNIHKSTIWEFKEGRSSLYNFERYRLEYPPEKFYSPEQWDYNLGVGEDGWTKITEKDIPPLSNLECHDYYNNRRLCQDQQRELEAELISINQIEIDQTYDRISEILLELKQSNGETKPYLVDELDLLSDRLETLTIYNYDNIPSCQSVLLMEVENFFEHHWVEKIYCDVEIYTGYLRYGIYGQLFSPDSQVIPVSQGDDFRQWQTSKSHVEINLHYGHYPNMGCLILSPHRYEYTDLETQVPNPEDGELLLHSPNYTLWHECRNINKKYRFKEIEYYSLNISEILVLFPEHTPFPLCLEVKKMRSLEVSFVDNPEDKNVLRSLSLGQSYSFYSRFLLISIKEPEFSPEYYPPNFAVKSQPFQRLKTTLTTSSEQINNTEDAIAYELSGRYPTNFPCLEIAYHHEYLGLQDWNLEEFTVEDEVLEGNINGPVKIQEYLSSLKIYDNYEDLIREELGGQS